MKTDRRWLLGMAFALPLLLLIGGTLIYADDDGDNDTVVRWDIINLFPPAPPSCPLPGGEASAMTHHNDNSTITLTGSGTFNPEGGDVSGGGAWETATASGTYKVKSLVLWQPDPGFNVCENDSIPGRRSAGLVVLRIKYNDGSRGVLTVSCRLPGSPPSMFEGIAVSKGVIGYIHNVEPEPGVNANRTLFHIQQDDDGGDGDHDD